MRGRVPSDPKPVIWVGSCRAVVQHFPKSVRVVIGDALFAAQMGDKHQRAKPLSGFGGASVLEIVDDFDGDTYRAIYTVRLAGAIYVLHAFQKKSKRGVATPLAELALIRQRLREAERHHQELEGTR